MNYRPEIDGLRAVAVLPVLFFHAGVADGGYIGVDIFFVISGYLIANIVLSGLQNNNFSLRKFYARRARRILPALFATMLISCPFAWLLMPTVDLKDFVQSIGAVTLFASNIFFWIKINFFGREIEYLPLVHTWSIGIEEQFYLLFPLLLADLWQYIQKYIFYIFICLIICSLVFSQYISFEHQLANYYLLPSRIWELMFGAMLAHLELKNGRTIEPILNHLMPLLGLFLIVLSVLTFVPGFPHPGFVTLIPVIGAGLIIWFSGQNDLGTFILRFKPIVGLGMISYSAYLIHQPILVFMNYSHNTQLVYLPLTIGIAYFLWRYIEQPFRDPKIINLQSVRRVIQENRLKIQKAGLYLSNAVFARKLN